MEIKEINKSTKDGRLLWAALIVLTTKTYSYLTPDQVLDLLEDKAKITIDLLKAEDDLNDCKNLCTKISKELVEVKHRNGFVEKELALLYEQLKKPNPEKIRDEVFERTGKPEEEKQTDVESFWNSPHFDTAKRGYNFD